jgi:hypothetical protein
MGQSDRPSAGQQCGLPLPKLRVTISRRVRIPNAMRPIASGEMGRSRVSSAARTEASVIASALIDIPKGYRIWPDPVTTYLVVVNSGSPIGPLACSFCVEMPISAPKPNSAPSVNRVDALTMTAAESTPTLKR